MNKTTEALKLAEEALSFYVEDFDCAADVIALAAIREALAEPVQEHESREDIAAKEMFGGFSKAWAAPVKQEPVAWMNTAANVFAQHPEGASNFGCDIPLYAAPVSAKIQADCTLAEHKCNPHPDAPHGFLRSASHSAGRYVCECEGWEPVKQEPVQRPQNCGTGYCSCIECTYEPVSIPDHITCPFCESDHVPDWLHDLKLDAKAIRAETLEEAAKVCRTAQAKGLQSIREAIEAAIRGMK